MKVFILTESGKDTGFGHLTRCIALYQAFEEHGIVPKILFNGSANINHILKDKNYQISNWLAEETQTLGLIDNADIVVVDSYLAELSFYQKIAKIINTPVYIDDTKRLDYPRGIVVNGTIYAEEFDYSKRKEITYLLGTKYMHLRKDFWNVSEKIVKENIGKALLTFGGADVRDMVPKILKLLIDKYPLLTKKVIIGKGFRNIKEIEEIKDNQTKLIYYPDSRKMKDVMMECDVAISAGGQTIYELARIGLASIVVAVADNQLYDVKGWKRAGFIEYAGWWQDGDIFDNLISSFNKLKNYNSRAEKLEIGRRLVDGNGANRIIDFLTEGKLC